MTVLGNSMAFSTPSKTVLTFLGHRPCMGQPVLWLRGYGTLLLLFSGRFNLDPFDRYTDEQIWDVLERTFLSMTVSSSKT